MKKRMSGCESEPDGARPSRKLLGLGAVLTILSLAFVVYGQTVARTGAAVAPRPAAQSTASASPTAAARAKAVTEQKQLIEDYCMDCHSKNVHSGGLSIEDLDIARVGEHRKEWEKIVKKLRAGMMPPSGQDRPAPAEYKGFITWLENELDRAAVPYMPPPGLHRMNRTEYANAIKDLLALEIDPSIYLPSDDSTRGFDNIASALTVSSTLVEAYVSAAGKISRLAIGEPATQTMKVYRVPEDTSQDYHIEGYPFGTRGGLIVNHIFPSDGEYTIEIRTVTGDNMTQGAFGTIPCEKLEVLLDGERLDLLNWAGGGGNRGGGAATCANTPNASARGIPSAAVVPPTAAAAGASPAAAAGTPAQAAAPAGPDAAATNLVTTVCASCHNLDRVKNKVADKEGWTATVTRMMGKGGASLTDQQVPVVIEFLTRAASTIAVPAAAGQQGQGQGQGQNRGGGGGGMRVRFKTTAGPHSIGATFLASNFAPLLDMNVHPARTTVQTGPTPGYTFFPHVGSIHIEGPFNATAPTDSASRRKIFTCKPTAATELTCARSILARLAEQAFRRPATAADMTVLMDFYQKGRIGSDFDHGIGNALAQMLADINFLARIEAEPATVKPGQAYAITDTELASRLSYFLWSTGPDAQLRSLAAQNRLKDPVVLEAQVRRMLKDPRAESIAVNFAGQWLNLRGMGAVGPLPMLYPDFDDPLRQAMRREVELLFDNIVREDRNLMDLLTADYTYVNERLARHYGIKGIYGSQFRRVVLAPEMDSRKGLLGKGAFLTTTAKPERNSPVTRGKIIMEKLLGVPPPDPPADVPPLMPKAADSRGNGIAPSMRTNMLNHRVRRDCIQCHALMDPIGFTLENFDAIGLWRTTDGGEPILASETLYDGTKVEGPAGLRKWLLSYSDQIMEVAAEKLLTYGLGRGVEAEDMPLVRKITRDAARNNNKFSALVLGVVKSEPFRKNMKLQETAIQKPTTSKEGN